jgi:4-hydroxy-tetrahydrodipicolinate synthase
MNPSFKGTGVALITPFNENRQVDIPALEKITDHVITGGVDYIVALGTTGESVTLSSEEKELIFNVIASTAHGRVPLVAGIGGNHTEAVAESMLKFKHPAYSAILSVTPYYNKPNQEGLYQHYKTIAHVAPLPVILYNVPGRTGVNMLPSTTLRLAHDFPVFFAVKEASGNIEQIMQVIRDAPSSFLTISGDDAITLPLIASGAHGVISVLANLLPKTFSEMVQLSLKGDFEKARALHLSMLEITRLLFADGNPGGVKIALSELGLCKPVLRQPLEPPSAAIHEAIKQELAKFR